MSVSQRAFIGYSVAQSVSVTGTWIQAVGSSWVIFQLSESGTVLGIAVAMQFLPLLLGGPYGGVLVDRYDLRRLLIVTQWALGLLSLVMGVLVLVDEVTLWMMLLIVPCMGLIDIVDLPGRDAFVAQMVPGDRLVRAAAVGPVLADTARAVGPLLAGLLITTVGPGWCFIGNALSYVPLIILLVRLKGVASKGWPNTAGEPSGVRDAFRLVLSDRTLLLPLVMVFPVGMLAYKFMVSLPLLAARTFDGSAMTLSLFLGALAVGSVTAGLCSRWLPARSVSVMALSAVALGLALGIVASAGSATVAVMGLIGAGASSAVFLALGNATLQSGVEPAFRGRIMAFWSMGLLGTTPVGGPIVGWVGEHLGPRHSVLLGAAAATVAGLTGWSVARRGAPREGAPDMDTRAPDAALSGMGES